MCRILIMVDEGVDDVEFYYNYFRFQEAYYEVDVVGSRGQCTYRGNHGLPVRASLSVDEVDIIRYDAIIIPGGNAPARMRKNVKLVNLVLDAYQKGKIIAAICAGPLMLAEAGILVDKKSTCHKKVSEELKRAGAIYVDETVVVDDKTVTSRFPQDLPNFCREILRLLKSKDN